MGAFFCFTRIERKSPLFRPKMDNSDSNALIEQHAGERRAVV